MNFEYLWSQMLATTLSKRGAIVLHVRKQYGCWRTWMRSFKAVTRVQNDLSQGSPLNDCSMKHVITRVHRPAAINIFWQDLAARAIPGKLRTFLKSALLVGALGLLCANSQAQVITIPNPDFERYTTCPASYNLAHSLNVSGGVIANSWIHPTVGSPDYINSCGYYPTIFRPAHSGSGLAGLAPEQEGGDYKEYLQTTLSAPMVAGITYSISFYMKAPQGFNELMAPTIPLSYRTFVNLPPNLRGYLGLMFSRTPPDKDSTVPIGNQDINQWQSIRNDFPGGKALIPASHPAYTTNSWTQVTLRYTAAGGEQYMTVGQFREGVASTAFGGTAYYLFDSFSAITPVNESAIRLQKAYGTPRLANTDQVTLSITGGAAPFSGTTTGTGSDVSSTAVVVSPIVAGTTYTLAETFVDPARSAFYDSQYACTNATAGGQTPSGAGTSFTVIPTATDNLTCTFTNRGRSADVQVLKTASSLSVQSGGELVFNLTATNSGPAAANGAVLKDAPDSGLDCASLAALATCTAQGGATCPTQTGAALGNGVISASGVAIPAFPANSRVDVTLRCKVTATGR